MMDKDKERFDALRDALVVGGPPGTVTAYQEDGQFHQQIDVMVLGLNEWVKDMVEASVERREHIRRQMYESMHSEFGTVLGRDEAGRAFGKDDNDA